MRNQRIIARGPFAASIALKLRDAKKVKSVCFDARGAYDAEFNEYDVAGSKQLSSDIYKIEKEAVLKSDFCMAVSSKLILYWKEKFGYIGENHVVIPCTVNRVNKLPDADQIETYRSKHGFSKNDILFVYSGSSSAWQSFNLMDAFLLKQMRKNTNIKVLMLCDKIPLSLDILREFPDRIAVMWLKEEQVFEALSSCDYGLLLRENSVTNYVSSPVKFAEYLAAGLSVVISDTIGDSSEFIQRYQCGIVLDKTKEPNPFSGISLNERIKNASIADTFLSKQRYLKEYSLILKNLAK